MSITRISTQHRGPRQCGVRRETRHRVTRHSVTSLASRARVANFHIYFVQCRDESSFQYFFYLYGLPLTERSAWRIGRRARAFTGERCSKTVLVMRFHSRIGIHTWRVRPGPSPCDARTLARGRHAALNQ